MIKSSGNGPDQLNSANLNSLSLSNYVHQTDLTKTTAITSKHSKKKRIMKPLLADILKRYRQVCNVLVLFCHVLAGGGTKKDRIKHEVDGKPKLLSFKRFRNRSANNREQ